MGQYCAKSAVSATLIMWAAARADPRERERERERESRGNFDRLKPHILISVQQCVLESRCESRSESLLLEAHSMWLPWAAGRLDGPCWTAHCSARAAEAQPEPPARRLPLAESPASPWARSWGFVRPAWQPPNIHLPPHSSRIPSRRSGRQLNIHLVPPGQPNGQKSPLGRTDSETWPPGRSNIQIANTWSGELDLQVLRSRPSSSCSSFHQSVRTCILHMNIYKVAQL